MGPVRIRHSSHDFGWQCSHSVVSLGGKPKWLPLKFGYHDVMRTNPIEWSGGVFWHATWLCYASSLTERGLAKVRDSILPADCLRTLCHFLLWKTIVSPIHLIRLPWPKNRHSRDIHEFDPQCDHEISCHIDLQLSASATRARDT